MEPNTLYAQIAHAPWNFLHCLVSQQGENTARVEIETVEMVEMEQQQTIGDETTVDGD